MKENKDRQFTFLIATIIAVLIIFGAGRLYCINKFDPPGRSFEVCNTVKFFRADLETIITKKIGKYAVIEDKNYRNIVGKEIDELSKVLDLPDNQDIIVYLHSPKGEAKSISDENVTALVIKSDCGWKLAKINFTGEK